MNYLINPDLQPNYLEIKNNFNNIKNSELKDIIPDYNILILNSFYSHSKGDFYIEREKYIGKTINIFMIQKTGIKQIIGSIFISDIQIIADIITYINQFVPGENVYIREQENLHTQINNYYKNLNINNNNNYTNIIYE